MLDNSKFIKGHKAASDAVINLGKDAYEAGKDILE